MLPYDCVRKSHTRPDLVHLFMVSVWASVMALGGVATPSHQIALRSVVSETRLFHDTISARSHRIGYFGRIAPLVSVEPGGSLVGGENWRAAPGKNVCAAQQF